VTQSAMLASIVDVRNGLELLTNVADLLTNDRNGFHPSWGLRRRFESIGLIGLIA
jgi:hypothetical protein